MSVENQTTLLGEENDETVTIETSGRTIRPPLELPDVLVDECRFEFDADGLHTELVDAANVGMLELNIARDAFEAYDLDGSLTVGTDLKTLRKQLSGARLGKSTDDPLTMELGATSAHVTIEREYEQTSLSRTGSFLMFDPDSIRTSPDVPNLRLSWAARLDTKAFRDTVHHVDETDSDAVYFTERDGDLVCSGKDVDDDGDIVAASETVFDGVAEPLEDPKEGVSSGFSLDYVTDMADGLRKAKIDRVTVRWGDGFPMKLQFERTDDDGEVLYSDQFMLAPRIDQNGGGE